MFEKELAVVTLVNTLTECVYKQILCSENLFRVKNSFNFSDMFITITRHKSAQKYQQHLFKTFKNFKDETLLFNYSLKISSNQILVIKLPIY